MKILEKIKKYDYKKNKYFLIAIAFLIFIGFYTYIINLSDLETISLNVRLVFMYGYYILTFVFILIIYFINKNKFKNIEKKFLVISLVLGTLYAIFLPTMTGTDEPPHFYRAYQISNGIIIDYKESNILFPENIVELEENISKEYTKDALFKPVSNKLVESKKMPTTYSPIQYIPQVIGIICAKLLNLSPVFMIILARLFNLYAFIFLAYKAIKIMPYKKEFLSILLLSPAILSLVATCNGDAFCLGLGFLFIAYVLKFHKEKKLLTNKDQIILFALSLGIASFKYIYILLLLILFILPKECFKNKKTKYQYLFIVLGVALFLGLSYKIAIDFSAINKKDLNAFLINEQSIYVRNNPIKFICIMISTYFNNAMYYLTNLVAGNEMCYAYPSISEIFCLGYLGLLIYSSFYDKTNEKLKKTTKYLFWIIFLIVFLATNYTMYVSYTATAILNAQGIGYPLIMGVQSRYFVLFIPLLMLTFEKIKNLKCKLINEKNLYKICLFLNIIIFIETITSVFAYILK